MNLMHDVALAGSARRFYEKADASLRKRLDRCFEILAQSPRNHPNIKALQGELKGRYRYRLGDYRIVYRIEDGRALVIVITITTRQSAY